MDLIGIENEAEFFPSGTLSDVLKEELQDITSRWAGLDKNAHPVDRLSRIAAPTIESLRQARNTSNASRRSEFVRDIHHALLHALGYSWKRDAVFTALDEAQAIPIVARAADATGRNALWVIEAPAQDGGDEAADPLGACFTADQFPPDVGEAALLDQTIESVLAEGVFELSDGPRHVLVLGLSQIVLIDKRKWPARSVLRFDLQEIFTRAERETLTVMSCLLSREARVPDQGTPISDRLEEEAQRNANAVTTSLKRTVRDAIELLGQEVLDVSDGKHQGVWIDGPELSRECLRYMYRLLFLFYAEANPRLNLLDLRDPIYATGYSLETLRELESVPLRTTMDREGTFLWDSLQRTLHLLYTGLDLADAEKGTGLRLPAVKVSLLDPKSTPILNSLSLRNEAIQKVIRLLSLRSTGKGTGRISYAKLGIGQLGAVYETLISFTGVVAKTDLIELKPRKGRSAEADNGADDEASDVDDEEEIAELDDADQEAEEIFRRDKIDPLAPSWFVPRSRIKEFEPEEIVFKGPEALVYPKGTFIYRLAGRDREKSASYYTPEPLARLLVKHALMERCRDLTADDLLDLKILEPAMGSAAFLVETTNQLADLYLERKQKETGETIPQDRVVVEKQKVRAYIADRNCFGVDLNPIAVELGAISLWLNSLHASDFSPWFGDQLHAGNSLIGARRASYPPAFLAAKKQADLWYNAKPEEIGWRNRLPESHVWQWLLPAKDMANFDKDKSIKPFAGDAQDQIKDWRKGGFFKKLEPHEVKLVQKLSRVAEALFDQVAEDLAKTRAAANDEITLWPDKVIPGNKGLDFQAKEKLQAHLIGADHARNTLPYKRLKTAMDAWCALWLWPLDKADLLPSRAEFLQGMAMILDGGFTPDGSLAAPSMDEFADPSPDFLDQLEPDAPARDLFRAAAKRQDGLFRETNVEALVETFDWLGVAVEVAGHERFVHFDLIFADVMKARGGFDVIVGNPPWAKPSFDEALAVSAFDPAIGAKSLKAKDVRGALPELLNNRSKLNEFIRSYAIENGRISFTSSNTTFPSLGAGANNLYACFLEVAWRVGAENGSVALIHQDRHLTDPKNREFRSNWYTRIRRHFAFRNELRSKNFADVGNRKEFSLNVYGFPRRQIEFIHMSGLLDASQVEDSFAHDGAGPIPPMKDDSGKWLVRGHSERIVKLNRDYLLKLSDSLEDGSDNISCKLPQIYSTKISALFSSSQAMRRSGEDLVFSLERPIVETDAIRERRVEKREAFVEYVGSGVLTAPMIKVGSAFSQCPGKYLRSHRDYHPLDLDATDSTSLIRFGYKLFQPPSILAVGESGEELIGEGHPLYAFAARDFIDVNGERSLLAGLVPSGLPHLHTVRAATAGSQLSTLSVASQLVSLPFDFFLRTAAPGHLDISVLQSLPFQKARSDALSRALLLFCHLQEFAALWNGLAPTFEWTGWSQVHPSLPMVDLKDRWSNSSRLTSDYARRLALVELDVLAAMALEISCEQLIEIFKTYYPILRQNEAGTWYDQHGRIVWTCSKGLPGVGWLDEKGKSPSRASWEKILDDNPPELTCTAIDDTMPGGPREVTRHFVGPFTKCARIEDYKCAWAHFERLKAEDAA
ncbi:N-6 DNA methylase [Thioclava sediminum]|nr:N-6 DNA methylase [Thioclava sediminum]